MISEPIHFMYTSKLRLKVRLPKPPYPEGSQRPLGRHIPAASIRLRGHLDSNPYFPSVSCVVAPEQPGK